MTRSTFAFAAVMLLAWVGIAQAGGRKRLVVLELQGPKAEKFHDDIEKILKKTHTVIPLDKWNSTAEGLDAGKVTEKNVKKVAAKLKVDGIVEGKIEKRRDEFIIRLKLREGKSGEVVGNPIDTKAEGPRIDGKAQRDIKDELLEQIDQLDANRGGDDDDTPTTAKKTTPAKKTVAKKDDDDDDDKPAAKKTTPAKKTVAKKDDNDDDDKPAAKKTTPAKKTAAKKDDDDDDKPASKKTAAKKDEPKKVAKKDDDDDDDKPAAKKAAAKKDEPKKVAKKDDDDDSAKKGDDDSAKKKGDDDDDDGAKKKTVASKDDPDGGDVSAGVEVGVKSATALTPAERAVDAAVGLSLMERRFSFTSNLDAMHKPPGYHQAAPVPGAYVDATIYPLAMSHTSKGALANLGVTLTLDRVLSLQTQITNADMTQVKLKTTEQRAGVGVAYRIPMSSGGMIAVGVRYETQRFSIDRTSGATLDIPDAVYSSIVPGAKLRYALGAKLYLDLDADAMVVRKAGQLTAADQYGQASVLGFAGQLGIDYMLTKNVFARVMGRFETVGLSFKGNGTLTNTRDGDPTSQDVTAARDSYFGGGLTLGYAY